MRKLNLTWTSTAKTLELDSCCMTPRQGIDFCCLNLSNSSLGIGIHHNKGLLSFVTTGENPDAPLEVSIPFSSWY